MSASCHDDAPTTHARKGSDAPIRGGDEARVPPHIVLIGRPNSGKSSLYNALTGGRAHVGNFPGITVDILEGTTTLPGGEPAKVVDLPGLYSVGAAVDAATDEGVARQFLDGAKARGEHVVLVQVVDPTRLALGLRLTRELLEVGLPLVVALTHGDVLAAEGRRVDTKALEESLGVPVVLLDLRSAPESAARSAVGHAIETAARATERRPAKDVDPNQLARDVVRDEGTPKERARRKLTERVDRVLLHPVLGPFLFVGIMAALFAAVFLVADPAATLMDAAIGAVRGWLDERLGEGLVTSLITDGILGGAGTVLAFMPQIVVLTIALDVLEASGYLARGAFLVDRLLRLLGLGGRSFVPLLMGHACAVPAISATRIIRDPRERLTTILVLPLMTCSARLPTYGLVLAAFFSERSVFFRAGLFVFLYFASIGTALVASWVLRRSVTKGKGLPLVLEMPAYRLPRARVIGQKALLAARRFLREVGTTIVAVSVVLWMLLTIPMPGARGPEGIESSLAAGIGRVAEPITKPAGFDWRMNVGLVGSFGAREVMVGTMGIIFHIDDADDDPAPLAEKLRDAKKPDGTKLYDVRTGLALLAFFMIACQCMSTVAAIRRETGGWKWPAFVLAYTYALGYVAAVAVYQIGTLLGVR